MPRKPKRPCSHPGCPELVDGRFCKKYEKEYNKHYEKLNTMKNSNETLTLIRVMEKHGDL